jgi:hypothetical protein
MLPPKPPSAAVVLSVDLLHSHRRILKQVFKDLIPIVHHVERDFASVNNAPEADILVSPGTGILLTTLQRLKQKPLPGQNFNFNGFRDRITKLSGRYETLFVLIGDALVPESDVVDDRDAESLADFVAFCSQCKADVQAITVPAGDESMATWIAAIICDMGATGQDLLQDETLVRHTWSWIINMLTRE